MDNLFNPSVYSVINKRLQMLTADAPAQWGKMDVAQMLAHCKEAFNVPLTEKRLPRNFLGLLFGWLVKAKLYNDSPWKAGLPTASNFIIKDARDFNAERDALILLVNKFYTAGPEGITKYPHPMFGKFTPDQWGQSMYKHLDHHLRQFGV